MISVTSPSSGGHSSQVPTPEVDSIESEGCLSTTKVQMRHALPYVIPTAIIKKHSKLDGRSLISGFDVDGWPSAFSPSDEFRSLCNTALSSPRPHPDQEREKWIPFNFCCIFETVERCPKCHGMHQVFPYEFGEVDDMFFLCVCFLTRLVGHITYCIELFPMVCTQKGVIYVFKGGGGGWI